MTRNLDTADKIVKLALSILTLIFYFADVIQGPLAQALAILSAGVIALFLLGIAFVKE